jgi:Protein of unknown function (DUF1236)
MHRLRCLGASLVVFFASAALATAQDSERKHEGKGGGNRPSAKAAPQSGALEKRQQAGPRQPKPQADVQRRPRERKEAVRPRFQGPAQPKQLMEQRSTKQRERAAERKDEGKRAGDRENERKRTADGENERKRAADGENKRKRAADREDERKRAVDRENERKRQADKKSDEPPVAEKREGPRAAANDEVRRKRLKLSVEQRVRLRSSFNINRGRVTNVRFARRVGTRIPRSIRLIAMPAAVYAVFPDYRSYSYVVVEDDIYIVDPATYEIVDVIDEDGPPSPSGAPQVAQLTLTAAERALVLDSIPPGFPEAEVSLRLALGGEVPSRVELHEFAPVVLDTVPKLRDFRFVLAQGMVAIVDPEDRSIELVLER